MRLVRVCLRAIAAVAVVGVCVWASSATASSVQALHRTGAGSRVRIGPATAPGVLLPALATEKSSYQPGVVLVGLRPGVKSSVLPALMRGVAASKHHRLGFIGSRTRAARSLQRRIGAAFVLRVPRGRVLWAVAWLRRQRRLVRYAEPNYLMQPAAATNVPNDPSFPLQWGSLNTGQSVSGKSGTAGADDGAARAWAHSTGSPLIVIGQVDTGVDYNHPDLAANIWSNPGGIGGCPAGTHGYDVLTSTCNPMDTDTSFNGHGTHVAGIMGAVGNNGAGVAGMNWSTTILPVRWVSDNNMASSTSVLISALDWLLTAQQAGVNVRVVNDSNVFIGTAPSQALSDEIDNLGANNILFVTAAGNTAENNDDPSVRRYPCGYNRPTEICVAASDQNDQLPPAGSWPGGGGSNYGLNTVDLAAPGDNIYSTKRTGNYGYISGTSMASPQVAGAAALILSVQNMTVTALKAQILNTVDPIPALSGKVRTGGRLDVCNAMPGCAVSASVNPVLIAADGSSTATVQASVSDAHGNPLSGETVSFTASDPGITFGSVTDHQDGTYTATVTSSTTAGQVTLTAHDRSMFGTTTLTQTATAASASAPPQRDVTPPTVRIFSPRNGATYFRGQRVTVSYTCSDNPGGAGVAICSGPVASGRQLHTATAGTFRFTVTSTDWAANTHVQTVRYRVVSRRLALPSRAFASHGRARLKVRCGSPVRCAGRLTLFTVVTVRVHGHRHVRRSVVASTHYSLPAGATRVITLKLTKAFQRRLRRHRHLRLQVSASQPRQYKTILVVRT